MIKQDLHNKVISFTCSVVCLSIISFTEDNLLSNWIKSSWQFAKMILPLLFAGILLASLLFGDVKNQGLIPRQWIISAVGENSVQANLIPSILGAFMYFATLTEIPILQGLINSGIGDGPALVLLLAEPALSLPNMLVIRSVIGTKKTVCYVFLVIIIATISGIIFGNIVS